MTMFGKKQRQTGPIGTLVGVGTTVTGDLDFRGGLHLDGRVVGDVRGEPGSGSSLTLGAGGVIEGSVEVDDLVLNGSVRGDVTARERVELGPAAQVDGNMSYKVLQMSAGARVNGRLIHLQGAAQALLPRGGETGAAGEDSAVEDEIPGLR